MSSFAIDCDRPAGSGREAQRPASHGRFLLYLPPYSPDLNPIELAFAKLKALLRKAAARSIDELWRVIADLLDEFSPDECQNFIRHTGYGSTKS